MIKVGQHRVPAYVQDACTEMSSVCASLLLPSVHAVRSAMTFAELADIQEGGPLDVIELSFTTTGL